MAKIIGFRITYATSWEGREGTPRHMTIYLPKREVENLPYYVRNRVAARAKIKGQIVILEAERIFDTGDRFRRGILD